VTSTLVITVSPSCVSLLADVIYTEPSYTGDQQASTGHTTRTADSDQRSWLRGPTGSADLRQSAPSDKWQHARSVQSGTDIRHATVVSAASCDSNVRVEDVITTRQIVSRLVWIIAERLEEGSKIFMQFTQFQPKMSVP